MGSFLGALELDHVGIAAAGNATLLTQALGAEALDGRTMPSGVVVARFGPGGRLELVWPGRPGTPIDGYLARRGPGLHHVALRVEGTLADALARARDCGLEPVGPIEPSGDGRPSAFLHPSTTDGVLVELLEGTPR
jgi:methylmalonyl-CoA/ethylmalonyl-CoA epimerase